MLIRVVAVGKMRNSPERDLVEKYRKRFDKHGQHRAWGPLEIIEPPRSQLTTPKLRKKEEAHRISKACEKMEKIVALHETGTPQSSTSVTKMLVEHQNQGAKSISFVVGGPDGLDQNFLKKADSILSLSSLTLSYSLARIILCEQLYRAVTIYTGHPYHRL